jgi:hypothetical protein
MTPVPPKSLSVDAQPCSEHEVESCIGREVEATGDWQVVLPRRCSCRLASRALFVPPRPIPAWLFGRCCRCLAHGHRAAVCRDPLGCSRCLENDHRARECRNPWHPLNSLACLAASTMSRLGAKPRNAPASCVGLMGSAPSKVQGGASWALVVSTPAGSASPSNVVLQSTLGSLVEQLQCCLGWELSRESGGCS